MAEPNEKEESQEVCDCFQDIVSEYLIRHQSILDIISKLQEASGRCNRALFKSVTTCGCIEINAQKQKIPEHINLTQMKDHIENHLLGSLCNDCRDVMEEELGKTLFYLTALCNTLGLSLEDVISRELNRVTTLGIFTLR